MNKELRYEGALDDVSAASRISLGALPRIRPCLSHRLIVSPCPCCSRTSHPSSYTIS